MDCGHIFIDHKNNENKKILESNLILNTNILRTYGSDHTKLNNNLLLLTCSYNLNKI